MESATVKADLINTLNILGVNEVPALTEQVIHHFINSSSSQVTNAAIISEINQLEVERKVFTNAEGFISFTKITSNEIEKKLSLEESTREKAKFASKVFKPFGKIPFIKFVGAIGDAPFGRIRKDQKINLIVVVEKDTKYLSKFLIRKYLAIKFASKDFLINRVIEIDNLKWSQPDAQNGIRLLNLLTFVNKDKTYENLMAANSWIFEIFTNYPLEKVSWGFRISKNIGNKVPGIYKKLNGFLTPKN